MPAAIIVVVWVDDTVAINAMEATPPINFFLLFRKYLEVVANTMVRVVSSLFYVSKKALPLRLRGTSKREEG
jgi:hypothetical protein